VQQDLSLKVNIPYKCDSICLQPEFFFKSRADWRLVFVNLKNDEYSNAVNLIDRDKLWMPNLVFENNPTRLYVENERLSFLRIRREGHPKGRFDFTLDEYQTFKGSENPIVYENIYDTKFECKMELHHYPFDTQHCFFKVSIHS